jgi:mannose-6-phosphate isomerase-like protein (cupin superfamily)
MSDAPYDSSQFDPATFLQEAYQPRHIDKPWGYELHWTPPDKPYMGKILHLSEGHRLSMQVHDKKQETWMILQGKAKVIWGNAKGELTETALEPGMSYSCAIGQRHRLVGVTDCDILEVSTPEGGTTWRLEDDYKRPDETDEQRAKERQGM